MEKLSTEWRVNHSAPPDIGNYKKAVLVLFLNESHSVAVTARFPPQMSLHRKLVPPAAQDHPGFSTFGL